MHGVPNEFFGFEEVVMSGPIVRTGATPRFSSNWEHIFGGKRTSTKAASKPSKKKAAAPKKKAAKKSAKKKTGRR
jgi:hypothetical protein